MKTRSLVGFYWREMVFAVAVALPWLVLAPLGLLWLWDQRLMIWWFAGAAGCGVVALVVRIGIARTAKHEAAGWAQAAAPASADWEPRDLEAWRLVEQIVAETEPFAFTDPAPIQKALLRTVDAVAKHYHPDADRPQFRITLPEFLLLVERSAGNARKQAMAHVPFVRLIRASDVLWIKEKAEAVGPLATRLYRRTDWAVRIARLVYNLPGAAMSELRRQLLGDIAAAGKQRMQAALTALLIRECGRAAIELYSGRLRLSSEEIRAADRTDRAALDDIGPVRLLLAGQVNAGKSSLFNALTGAVHRHIGVEASRQGPGELELRRDGTAAVILREMQGLPATIEDGASFLSEALQHDLIVWVASATQPAREPDVRALKLLQATIGRDPARRMPPVVVAATHVDRLSPRAEWAPPYDLHDEQRPKSRAIREAVTHMASILEVEPERVVPVCLKEGIEPYNVDVLWAAIAGQMSEARKARLNRIFATAPAWTLSELARQALASGRVLGSAVLKGRSFGRQQSEQA
jgi:uncharacterized protein